MEGQGTVSDTKKDNTQILHLNQQLFDKLVRIKAIGQHELFWDTLKELPGEDLELRELRVLKDIAEIRQYERLTEGACDTFRNENSVYEWFEKYDQIEEILSVWEELQDPLEAQAVFCDLEAKQITSEAFLILFRKHYDQKKEELGSLKWEALRSEQVCSASVHAKKMYLQRYKDRKSSAAGSWFHGKGALYTINIGHYDELKEPAHINPEWDYFCITDDPDMKSSVYRIIVAENEEELDPPRLYRKYKLLSHILFEDYDYTVYIDGKIMIDGDMREYIDWYAKDSSMLCIPHGASESPFEEAERVKYLQLDDVQIIDSQMERYRKEGYPDKLILTDNSVLVRSTRDPVLNRVMEDWLYEVLHYSKRDQLSLGYACWKNGFEYDISDLCAFMNPYFHSLAHNK